jgi:hypothetical protein
MFTYHRSATGRPDSLNVTVAPAGRVDPKAHSEWVLSPEAFHAVT